MKSILGLGMILCAFILVGGHIIFVNSAPNLVYWNMELSTASHGGEIWHCDATNVENNAAVISTSFSPSYTAIVTVGTTLSWTPYSVYSGNSSTFFVRVAIDFDGIDYHLAGITYENKICYWTGSDLSSITTVDWEDISPNVTHWQASLGGDLAICVVSENVYLTFQNGSSADGLPFIMKKTSESWEDPTLIHDFGHAAFPTDLIYYDSQFYVVISDYGGASDMGVIYKSNDGENWMQDSILYDIHRIDTAYLAVASDNSVFATVADYTTNHVYLVNSSYDSGSFSWGLPEDILLEYAVAITGEDLEGAGTCTILNDDTMYVFWSDWQSDTTLSETHSKNPIVSQFPIDSYLLLLGMFLTFSLLIARNARK